MTTNEDLDRLRLAAEDAAGGPPSAEQVDALIDLVDALEARLAALTTPQEGDARERLKRQAEVSSEQRLKDSIEEWRQVLGFDYGATPDDWELEFWHAGYKHGALAVIEHVLPVLSRDIAGEIEAEVAWFEGRGVREVAAYLDGLRRAAEIVRNGR